MDQGALGNFADADFDASGDDTATTVQPCVLVAEDHEIGQELACMMVARLGARVERAADGLEALAMIEQAATAGRDYSLVLMDFMMPILDGIEATRRIRERGFAASRLPIVALTANAESRDIARFMSAGGQAYLPKPMSLKGLQAVFDAWLPGERAVAQPQGDRSEILGKSYELRKSIMIDTIDKAIEAGDCSTQTLELLLDMLHKLAGTAGWFGDEALSIVAARFETALLRAEPADVLGVLNNHRGSLANAI
jgi:CheY-like chemotaxis protein